MFATFYAVPRPRRLSAAAGAVLLASLHVHAQVSSDRVLGAAAEPRHWLTYVVDGKQYVTVIAGNSLVTFALRN